MLKTFGLRFLRKKDDESGIDFIELFNKMITLESHFAEVQPNDRQILLQYIFGNGSISTFSNSAKLQRIFLIVSVSVTSGERSVSKLNVQITDYFARVDLDIKRQLRGLKADLILRQKLF